MCACARARAALRLREHMIMIVHATCGWRLLPRRYHSLVGMFWHFLPIVGEPVGGRVSGQAGGQRWRQLQRQ